ncbi:hypothetical protein ACHAWF_002138 [Thalassiosira exigua]
MSFLLSSIHSALSHYVPVEWQPFQSSVAQLSTRDRASLVGDVAMGLDREGVESTLEELDATLAECRASLESFERKERFLHVRLDRYRTLMGRREERMSDLRNRIGGAESNTSAIDDGAGRDDSGDDIGDDVALARSGECIDVEKNDLENLTDRLNEMQSKHSSDQTMFSEVEGMHKDIIVQISQFRYKIKYLEEKQQDTVAKRDECQEFLIAAMEYGEG